MFRTWLLCVPWLALAACVEEEVDADVDGYLASEDCDDADQGKHPNGVEICDGKDNDCDGEADNDAQGARPFYLDADGDGHGLRREQIFACFRPEGYSDTSDDCRDDDPEKHPLAVEQCNNQDDDCDGEEDEGLDLTVQWFQDADHDGFGGPTVAGSGCIVRDDWVRSPGDCNDASSRMYPGAKELCNGFDDDCDGLVDDDDTNTPPLGGKTWYPDVDNDGFGWPLSTVQSCTLPNGYVENADDCDDQDPDRNPTSVWFRDADDDGRGDPANAWATAQCWRPIGYIDDRSDCDDADPERDAFTPWYVDFDGDGFGQGATPVAYGCVHQRNLVNTPGDCDDRDPAVLPGATEVCDLRDNNCDGATDDADPSVAGDKTFYIDRDLDGYGNAGVTSLRCAEAPGWVPSDADCNDRNEFQHPESAWWEDVDRDGLGNPSREWPTRRCEGPPGFVLNRADCDDTDRRYHNFTEWFRDRDEDGFGAGDPRHLGCPGEATDGLVQVDGDCDDRDPSDRSGTCGTETVLKIAVLTDSWPNETGVRITCNGNQLLNVQPGNLTQDYTTYEWDVPAPAPANCTFEVLDSYGDGGPTGTAYACDEALAEQYVSGSGGAIYQGPVDRCGCSDPLAWNWDPASTAYTATCIYPTIEN
jgi:hypothetical protein